MQIKQSRYNWFTSLRQEILKLNIPFVKNENFEFNWDYLSIGDLISTHVHNGELVDTKRCDNSSYSSFYHRMKSGHSPEPYLSYKISLQQKQAFCNMRLHADRLPFLSIYTGNNSFKFQSTEKCPLCGKDNDDLFHALTACIHYDCIRPVIFSEIRNRLHTNKLFRTYDLDYVKGVCNFVNMLLRRRQFLLGDWPKTDFFDLLDKQ